MVRVDGCQPKGPRFDPRRGTEKGSMIASTLCSTLLGSAFHARQTLIWPRIWPARLKCCIYSCKMSQIWQCKKSFDILQLWYRLKCLKLVKRDWVLVWDGNLWTLCGANNHKMSECQMWHIFNNTNEQVHTDYRYTMSILIWWVWVFWFDEYEYFDCMMSWFVLQRHSTSDLLEELKGCKVSHNSFTLKIFHIIF